MISEAVLPRGEAAKETGKRSHDRKYGLRPVQPTAEYEQS